MKMALSIIITSVYTRKTSKTTRTEIIETAHLKKSLLRIFYHAARPFLRLAVLTADDATFRLLTTTITTTPIIIIKI